MTLLNAPFPYPFIPNIPCKTEPVSVPEIEFSTDKRLPPPNPQVEKQNVPKSFLGSSTDIPTQEPTDSSSAENIDVVTIIPDQTTSAKYGNGNNDYVVIFDLDCSNEVRVKTGSVTGNSISQAETSRPSSV